MRYNDANLIMDLLALIIVTRDKPWEERVNLLHDGDVPTYRGLFLHYLEETSYDLNKHVKRVRRNLDLIFVA